jgi:UDP-N-acetylmuramoylalanine--D-glutamate ligase
VITARAFAGKHYAVLGLARSGLATVEALLASGARVTAWDDNPPAQEKLFSREGGSPDAARSAASGSGLGPCLRRDTEWDLSCFDSIVVTPGLPLNRHPIAQRAREAGVEIIGDIELFARARAELPPHKVVGITGTNGKSTTTALVHHILKTAGVPTEMGGNIGLPILGQDPLPEGGVYVLELSSYQIDLTKSLDCDVAVLLNITPDHLDRYESFEAYAASKERLFDMQSAEHAAIIAGGDEASLRVLHSLRSPAKAGAQSGEAAGALRASGLPPSRENILWLDPTMIVESHSEWSTLRGHHNAQNAAAAMATCSSLGLALSAVRDAVATYPGLPHRMERVREKDGVLFVNDSKATNPTATAPALAAFPKIRWILGGQAKTDNLDECAPHFGHVRKAYTIGEAGEMFASLLSPQMAVAECVTLGEAVKAAASEAQKGETVLLSPACASFDQFRDFEARGDAFRALVGEL